MIIINYQKTYKFRLMKHFLKQVERNCISGALVFLPLIVLFLIMEKVWSFFQKYGEKVADLFHLDKIFGTIARDILGGIFLVTIIYFSGYLMRLAYLKKISEWIDDKLMIFLPGYEKNKKMAEEKLKSKIKNPSSELPVLVKFGDYWQPAHLIEEDAQGQAVVFVPMAPFRDQGHIYVVSSVLIKKLPNTTLAALDNSIKSFGKGFLNFN